MRTLNLGILAHVDAGKTSLTERLLYAGGAIDTIGRVDDGTAQTDSLALERQRGITIKTAVASFEVDDVTVNLIDTPGHPDFIAEVERALRVLDGAVLVVSAVEGVQAQTRVLVRALRRQQLPVLVFVNKIDRRGARDVELVRDLAELLELSPLTLSSVADLGTPAASVTPYDADDADVAARQLALPAEQDDDLLTAFLTDAPLPRHRLREALAAQTRSGLVQPVTFGSAMTGAGIPELLAAVVSLLPTAGGAADDEAAGTVFKIEQAPTGERIAHVRMFAGTLRVRDRVVCGNRARRKITAISVFRRGSSVASPALAAGEIGTVSGLGGVRIGDDVGTLEIATSTIDHGSTFARPTLESVVVPRSPADRRALHDALTRLAEQDPLINLRASSSSQQTVVSLYGEVQKEVIRDTLASDFGLHVDFLDSTPVYVERPLGEGTAEVPLPHGRSAAHPLLAGLGLRVEPGSVGSGVLVALEIERGSLPRAFLKAIDDSVPAGLAAGPSGWRVID